MAKRLLSLGADATAPGAARANPTRAPRAPTAAQAQALAKIGRRWRVMRTLGLTPTMWSALLQRGLIETGTSKNGEAIARAYVAPPAGRTPARRNPARARKSTTRERDVGWIS